MANPRKKPATPAAQQIVITGPGVRASGPTLEAEEALPEQKKPSARTTRRKAQSGSAISRKENPASVDVYGVQLPAALVDAFAPALEEWGPTLAAGVALFRAVQARQARRRK